jgi:KDO2-lipid IV(A) lauroyltransferase
LARLYLARSLQWLTGGRPRLARALAESEAVVLRSFWAASRRMSPDQAVAQARNVMMRVGPRLRRHDKLVRNLSTAFPQLSTEDVEATARESWGHIGQVIAEYPHLARICGPDAEARIEIRSEIDLEPIRSGKQPAIFVAAHLANWEMAGAMASRAGLPLTCVYSPQQNEAIERLLQRQRQALGCTFVDKAAGAQGLVGELRRGRSLGILVDQRYDESDSVPFFGLDAPAPLGPATLAARLRLPFVPVRIERLDRGCRFRITAHPPIEPDRSVGDAREVARDMTARLYALFETWIRERPEQWLCLKRRWPDLRRGKWREMVAENPRLMRSLAGSDGPTP